MSNLQPVVHAIFEGKTSTWQYVVACPTTKDAMIIDPVLDFGQEKLTITTESALSILHLVAFEGYHVIKLLETARDIRREISTH